jgi:hypothetical protein
MPGRSLSRYGKKLIIRAIENVSLLFSPLVETGAFGFRINAKLIHRCLVHLIGHQR